MGVSPSAAMGAGAIGKRLHKPILVCFSIRNTGNTEGFSNEIEDVRVLETIIYVASITARSDQSLTA
jgi:hypothetical protein